MPINQQEALMESTFHNRAALVITSLLSQLNIDSSFIGTVKNIAKRVSNIPPVIFSIAGIKTDVIEKVLNDIQPLLAMSEGNEDIESIVKMVPEENLLFFINQVITRLEWVKNGNESGHKSE